jgi:hypothetical protein
MRLLLARIVPWLQILTINRPFAGNIFMLLQFILIGWIPAAIWFIYALSQHMTDKKHRTRPSEARVRQHNNGKPVTNEGEPRITVDVFEDTFQLALFMRSRQFGILQNINRIGPHTHRWLSQASIHCVKLSNSSDSKHQKLSAHHIFFTSGLFWGST